MSREPLRVGVVGARKRRQGVGEHLARFSEAAGARVVAIAGTSPATVAEARAALETRWGIRVAGHVGVREMVATERLDALVIASPAAVHREHLEIGLEARLHVLCEKPIVWSETGDFAADAARLAKAFAARSRLLVVNEQWPYTLPAYRALYPDVALARARKFGMRLSPGATRRDALVDAMPHALSLLSAVHPDAHGPLRDVRVRETAPDGALSVTFLHPGSFGDVECSIALVPCFSQPRPASYAFDGREARRTIAEPGYRMSFETPPGGAKEGDGVRRVGLADPMEALVRDFVGRAVAGGPFPCDPSTARRSARLLDVLAATGRNPAAANDMAPRGERAAHGGLGCSPGGAGIA